MLETSCGQIDLAGENSSLSLTFLDGTAFTAEQIRFVALIVDELTRNGRMDPGRLYESPYTDHAPAVPDSLFPALDVDDIVSILRRMNGEGETEVA